MQNNITKKVDRYLDNQLGLWSRLLPWRYEMVLHLEEAYEASLSDSKGVSYEDLAWQRTLKDFGNVKEVANQLRKEHWPQHTGIRLAALVFALSIIFSNINPLVLFDLSALVLVLCPMLAFVLFDTYGGSTRWGLANRVGTWGGTLGAIAGLVIIMSDWGNLSYLRNGIAISFLSAFYCVAFFTPQRSTTFTLLVITIIEFFLVMFVPCLLLDPNDIFKIIPYYFSPAAFNVDNYFILQASAITVAGHCLGITHYGFHGVSRHAFSIATGVFLLILIKMLNGMSDPSRVMGDLVVAFGALLLSMASIHFVSDATRLLRRLRCN